MLEVLPIQSKSEQETACMRCGVIYDADLLAYQILDNGSLAGVCQFRITPEGGSIKNISGITGSECFENIMFLGRGTFNFIDNCGMRYAFLDDPTVDDVTAAAIGFRKDEKGRWFVDLRHFFDAPCSQKNQ